MGDKFDIPVVHDCVPRRLKPWIFILFVFIIQFAGRSSSCSRHGSKRGDRIQRTRHTDGKLCPYDWYVAEFCRYVSSESTFSGSSPAIDMWYSHLDGQTYPRCH